MAGRDDARREVIGAILLITGLVLVLGLSPSCVFVSSNKSPQSTTQGIDFERAHGPFLHGSEVNTITSAEALIGRHIVRPSHSQANDSTIQHIFFERIPGDPNEIQSPLRADVVHVAIDYQSGILVTVELVAGTQNPFDLDPASQYRLMTVDSPGAKTIMVLGSPAMTIPRDGSGPAIVDVTMKGERIVIGGDYAPLEVSSLLEIAQTLS